MNNKDPSRMFIYERVGDQVFARRFNCTKRVPIYTVATSTTESEQLELQEWSEILKFGRQNSVLQTEIEHVKMLYYLLKQ